MNDLLTHLAAATRFLSDQSAWLVIGAAGLIWVWYRGATSALPGGGPVRSMRRPYGA